MKQNKGADGFDPESLAKFMEHASRDTNKYSVVGYYSDGDVSVNDTLDLAGVMELVMAMGGIGQMARDKHVENPVSWLTITPHPTTWLPEPERA